MTLVIIIHAYVFCSEVSPLHALKQKLFEREERSASLDHVFSEKLSTAIKVHEPEDLDFLCFHLLLLSAFILFVFSTTSEFTLLCYRLI